MKFVSIILLEFVLLISLTQCGIDSTGTHPSESTEYFSFIHPLVSDATVIYDNESAVTDLFVDDTNIETLINTVQITDKEFGKRFEVYENNPLSSTLTCDPWDSGGDPNKLVTSILHPDIQYFPKGKDGYKFWMVYSPMGNIPEGGDCPHGVSCDDYYWENSTIIRSNDGINWVKEGNYTNPVILPEGDERWHSDPDFVYAANEGPNGDSWLLYWTVNYPASRMWVATSSDGLNYTRRKEINSGSCCVNCSSIVYDAKEPINKFKMWYKAWDVLQKTDDGVIGYAYSSDGINYTPHTGDWYNAVFTKANRGISHLNVVKYNEKYWMYYLEDPLPFSYSNQNIALATSSDGLHWEAHPVPVLTPSFVNKKNGNWLFTQNGLNAELKSFYRPTVCPIGDTIYLYFPGTDHSKSFPQNPYRYDLGLAKSGPQGYIMLEGHEYINRPNTLVWLRLNEVPSEYDTNNSAVAWYHFDEGSGNDVIDTSSNQNHGTITTPQWTEGILNNALHFDGNDRVIVQSDDVLNTPNSITIEAWVNPSVHSTNHYIISRATDGGTDFAYGLKLETAYSGGISELGACIRNSAGTWYFAYGGYVPTNEWTHVAMTYEVSTDGPTQIRLFINGREVEYRQHPYFNWGTDTIPAGTYIRTNNAPLNIGALPNSPWYGNYYFNGDIDEVRLLNTALSETEIATNGVSHFDESSNNNNGSRIGVAHPTPGRLSNGIEFNGNGSVIIPNSDTLDSSDSITVEAWVNPSLNTSNNYILSRATDSGNDFAYGIKLETTYTGFSELGAIIRDSAGISYYAYGGYIPLNEWTHVAMTYEVNDNGPTQVRLFINGIEVDYRYTDTIPASTYIRSNDGPINIGVLPNNAWPGYHYFYGIIDEVRILGQALTEDELSSDFRGRHDLTGNITSKAYTLPSGKTWDKFYAVENCPAGTSITYSIPSHSLTIKSGDDLSSLGNSPIVIRADLVTNDSSKTPILDNWGVTFK